ncbi:MAG: hypothetical protein ACREL5_07105 [Gemmatimonadales bacterium]
MRQRLANAVSGGGRSGAPAIAGNIETTQRPAVIRPGRLRRSNYVPGMSSRDAGEPSPAPSRATAGTWSGLAFALAGRSLVSPRLAIDLLRALWAFRRRAWWRIAPFLPVPDPAYLRWRMYTAYGDERAVPPLADVVRFARWRRTTMRL